MIYSYNTCIHEITWIRHRFASFSSFESFSPRWSARAQPTNAVPDFSRRVLCLNTGWDWNWCPPVSSNISSMAQAGKGTIEIGDFPRIIHLHGISQAGWNTGVGLWWLKLWHGEKLYLKRPISVPNMLKPGIRHMSSVQHLRWLIFLNSIVDYSILPNLGNKIR